MDNHTQGLSLTSFALQSDQLEQDFPSLEGICQTLLDGLLPSDSLTLSPLDLPSSLSAPPPSSDIEEEPLPDRRVCIDPVCLQSSRQVTGSLSHVGHQQVSLQDVLERIKVLKCNHRFEAFSAQRLSRLLQSLDRVEQQVKAFQTELVRRVREAKGQMLRHIALVRSSFTQDLYCSERRRLLESFNYESAVRALGQAEKLGLLRYDNLEYPIFKAGVMQARLRSNRENRAACLEAVARWTDHLLGVHCNYSKTFNRSAASFMFRSPSEKRIFSYYLKSTDYAVAQHGKTVRRLAISQELPLALLEKRLSGQKIVVRVGKMGPKGVAIGCGLLAEIERRKFNNCYSQGFFLHSKGVVFSEQVQTSGVFSFKAGDLLSLHRQEHRIYFHKLEGSRAVEGFYVNLRPSHLLSPLNDAQHYYPAVFLGDIDSEVTVLA